MRFASITAVLLALPSLAHADRIKPSGHAQLYEMVATGTSSDDMRFARQVLPATGSSNLVAQSRVIYLNKNGATLYPGDNDSRTNRSTIVQGATAIPKWNVSAATWAATVACVRDIFAPFDVSVVDTDPGNVPHIEAIFGGSPGTVGMGPNVAGVSPFTLDCSIIENSIVFTFTDVIPQDARVACEIQAQEIAHSFGLDHELLASDPMTYLQYTGNRSFKDQTASCGEYSQRACGINGSVCRQNQNSVSLLRERLGEAPRPDTVAPVLAITSPTNNATVRPGFTVVATATDDVAVTKAQFFIDDNPAGEVTTAPFELVTPASLVDGSHTIRIDVTDGTNTTSQQVAVTVSRGGGTGGGDGDGDGDGTGGNGTGGGTGGGNGTGDGGSDPSSDISGGCSTGGGTDLGALAALGALLVRRRRRC